MLIRDFTYRISIILYMLFKNTIKRITLTWFPSNMYTHIYILSFFMDSNLYHKAALLWPLPNMCPCVASKLTFQ